MSFLAIDLAIFERLVGAPLDSSGRPKLDAATGIPVNRLLVAPALSPNRRYPSYGVRIPSVRKGVDTSRGQSTNNSNAFKLKDFDYNSHRNIPVFPVNIAGRKWEDVWPAVTFYWYDTDFNADTFVYADPFGGPDPTKQDVNALGRNGQVVATGPGGLVFRAHPEPYDETYIIRVWSKDFTELKLICESVRKLFPARGVLEVEQADGTKLPFDMMLERIENLDDGGQDVGMAQQPKEQRVFSRAFVYKIESYVDNTGGFDTPNLQPGCSANVGDGGSWSTNVITSRILELADAQDSLIETTVIDELEVVTPP